MGMGMGDDWEMGNWEHLGEDGISIPSFESEKKGKKLVFGIPSLYSFVTSVHKRNRGFSVADVVTPNISQLCTQSPPHPIISQSQSPQQPNAPNLPNPQPSEILGNGQENSNGRIGGGEHLGKTGKFRTARKRKVKKTCLCHYVTHIFLWDSVSRTPPLFVAHPNSHIPTPTSQTSSQNLDSNKKKKNTPLLR